MLSFITACVVVVAIAYGGAIVLDHYQKPVDAAFASPGNVRI